MPTLVACLRRSVEAIQPRRVPTRFSPATHLRRRKSQRDQGPLATSQARMCPRTANSGLVLADRPEGLGQRVARRRRQQDWDSALRDDVGNVNAVGLYDLDRNIRPVGRQYKRLIADWSSVLPTQSYCLVLPLEVPEEHATEPAGPTRSPRLRRHAVRLAKAVHGASPERA